MCVSLLVCPDAVLVDIKKMRDGTEVDKAEYVAGAHNDSRSMCQFVEVNGVYTWGQIALALKKSKIKKTV